MTPDQLEATIEKAREVGATSLDLSNLNLLELPDSIGILVELEKLNICGNKLTRLPESIGNLRALKCLQTSNNKISFIPDSIVNLTNLNCLTICYVGNNFPEVVCEILGLTYLDISRYRYSYKKQSPTLLSSIGNLIDLRYLKLSGFNLPKIPDIISDLAQLKVLKLSSNHIESLPDSIGELARLEVLQLDRNHIKRLPSSISKLVNLKALSLSNNNICQLPDDIGNLTKLTKLDLSENQIKLLPSSVKHIHTLNALYISDNPLTDLSAVQSLQNLKVYLEVFLPRHYWMKFSDWNPEWLLDEENAEIRRVLIEQVGYEKIYAKLGAIEIDTWREYELMRIDGSVDIEPILLLKMTCPSTQHIHILRVPPTMTSAEDAITWVNHGIHPDNFAVQT